MPTVTLSCDIYKLEKLNSVVTAYQKNGTMSLGRNIRDNSYVSEILCNPLNLASIPTNSSISNVTIKYVVAANNILATTGGYIKVYNQDKSSWTDTGSAPIYSTFASTAWGSLQITDTYNNQSSSPTGNYTLITSSTFNTLVYNWINGIVSSWGFILSLDCAYFDSYLTINTVTIDVTYTQSNKNNFYLYYKRQRAM